MTDSVLETYEDIAFIAIPYVPAVTGGILVSKACLVGGWSFKETAGAPAEIDVIDGGNAQSVPYAFITLNAGQSMRDILPAPGLFFRQGLFINAVAGAVAGSVWVRLL